VSGEPSTAIPGGPPVPRRPAMLCAWAAEARKQADLLACKAWNKRMLGFRATS